MTPATGLRIGEMARLAGTTVRTIRYYEEIGLLAAEGSRSSGSHRVYTEEDAAHLRAVLRLKDLLGVSLEELKELVAEEQARAGRREEFHATDSPKRRAELAAQGLASVERQLDLVARRQAQLDELRAELTERRARIRRRLRET